MIARMVRPGTVFTDPAGRTATILHAVEYLDRHEVVLTVRDDTDGEQWPVTLPSEHEVTVDDLTD